MSLIVKCKDTKELSDLQIVIGKHKYTWSQYNEDLLVFRKRTRP